MPKSIIDEIYEEIQKQNSNSDNTAIPHSDDFIRKVSSMLGVNPDLVKRILEVLVNSHKVFSFEIILPDSLRGLPGVNGFVVADLNVIRRLKNVFYKELTYLYNQQYHKSSQAYQIIKEIFPIIRSFNNSPLGITTNKAIMLEELEKLMEKHFNEYTEDYKEKQFALEIGRANLERLVKEEKKAPGKATAAPKTPAYKRETEPPEQNQRAVDSTTYNEFIIKKSKYPLQRILNIYGIDFFYKVNLRNYQFKYLQQLIKDGQISKRSDLMHLREMLKTVRQNMNIDPGLKDHTDEIFDLEKTIAHYLYFSSRELK